MTKLTPEQTAIKLEKRKVAMSMTTERREKIKDLIKTIGLWNINKAELARHFNVERLTIHNDCKQLVKGMRDEDLGEIKIELSNAGKLALRKSREMLMTARTQADMARAISLINETINSYTKFLEDFGIKERIAEKLEISQQTINVYKEMKEYKATFEILKKLPEEEQEKLREVILYHRERRDKEDTEDKEEETEELEEEIPA